MCLMPVQASLWAHRTKLCLQGLVTIWQQIHAVAATCLPAGEAADIPVSSQGPDHDAGFYVGVKEGFSKKGVGGLRAETGRRRKELHGYQEVDQQHVRRAWGGRACESVIEELQKPEWLEGMRETERYGREGLRKWTLPWRTWVSFGILDVKALGFSPSSNSSHTGYPSPGMAVQSEFLFLLSPPVTLETPPHTPSLMALLGLTAAASHLPRPAPRRPDLSPFSSGSTSAFSSDSRNPDLTKDAAAQKIQPGASLSSSQMAHCLCPRQEGRQLWPYSRLTPSTAPVGQSQPLSPREGLREGSFLPRDMQPGKAGSEAEPSRTRPSCWETQNALA